MANPLRRIPFKKLLKWAGRVLFTAAKKEVGGKLNPPPPPAPSPSSHSPIPPSTEF